MSAMRLGTFNLENLDLTSDMAVPFEARAAALRPALERIKADILCLQEVNGQHVPDAPERRLVALERLLQGTRYETYHRAATSGPSGRGVASVHNLVTLSRFPIRQHRDIRHERMKPILHGYLTGTSRGNAPEPIAFDRPLLYTEIALANGSSLDVINLQLRAARASAIPGEKLSSSQWRTTTGWAEGYFVSSLKRNAQALELRLIVDDILARAPERLIAIAGDFNAEDYETPLRLMVAATEETGNATHAARSLTVLDQSLPSDRRWSVLVRGRPEMLDHILVSQALHTHFRAIEVYNHGLADAELVGAAIAGSSHAPLVAELACE
jgi:endonuclease/exonuclease/phosphatase family metal-dependent hydrolase